MLYAYCPIVPCSAVVVKCSCACALSDALACSRLRRSLESMVCGEMREAHFPAQPAPFLARRSRVTAHKNAENQMPSQCRLLLGLLHIL